MKALVGAFNQEKALVGAFSVIVQTVVEPINRFAALKQTLDILDTDNSQWARNFLDVIMWCAKLPPDHHYCSGPENFAH